MRRSVLILAVMGVVVLCAGRGSSQSLPPIPPIPGLPPPPAVGATGTFVGMLVDSACFAIKGRAVLLPDHAPCAIACALKGNRLAVITATGTLYMVTGILAQDNNAKLIPLINKIVLVTGTVGTIQPSPVLNPVPSGDNRRPNGTEDGVAVKRTVRKGDFREGDVPDGPEMIVDALSIDVAIKFP